MTRTVSRRRPEPADPAAPGEPVLGPGRAAAVYFALALLYFFPALIPGRGIFGTDFLSGGFFFYQFISERLADGALPKWVPYVYGGLPLFSNPGSTYHPVHLLAELLLPTERVLTVVFIVQFWVGAIGTYLLARELGCRSWVAFLAGLAFEFSGILVSWVFAGHDGRVLVATMAPLFFFLLHRGVRLSSAPTFAGAAATLGTALLSFQIQSAYYLLLGGAFWGAFCLVHLGVVRRPRPLVRAVVMGLAAVGMGFLLAAVNFLPFQGYVPDSPRGDPGGRGYEYSTSYSMEPADLLAVAVPEQPGVSIRHPLTRELLFPGYRGSNPMKLHTEYMGALVVVLVLAGFWFGRRDRYWLFFLGLLAFFLTLALGGSTPLYRLYYEVLPGLKRFRAPGLAYYVVSFCMVIMSALTLERLAALREGWAPAPASGAGGASSPGARPLAWILAALVVLVALGSLTATAGESPVPGEPSRAAGWWRFLLFAGVVGGLLWAWLRRALGTAVLIAGLAVATVADQWVVGRRFFHTVPSPDQWFAPDDVVRFLQAQQGLFRVWNIPGAPHRGLQDNYLMYFRLEQAGGEHGNQLQRWNEYVGAGTDVYVDWGNFLRFPGMVAAANVRYFVSTDQLDYPGVRQVHSGRAYVYENALALPRAFMVPVVVEVREGEALEAMRSLEWDPTEVAFVEADSALDLPLTPLDAYVEVIRHQPDEVSVLARTNRTALLVLADNWYDGWEATVGGEPAPILRTNHTFRGIVVPPGEHRVELVFRPRMLYRGLWLSLAALALLIGYGLLLLVRSRASGPRAPA